MPTDDFAAILTDVRNAAVAQCRVAFNTVTALSGDPNLSADQKVQLSAAQSQMSAAIAQITNAEKQLSECMGRNTYAAIMASTADLMSIAVSMAQKANDEIVVKIMELMNNLAHHFGSTTTDTEAGQKVLVSQIDALASVLDAVGRLSSATTWQPPPGSSKS